MWLKKLISMILVFALVLPLFVGAVPNPRGDQTGQPEDTDLVLHIDFEENNRSTSKVYDQSGQENHGDIHGNVTFVPGITGDAAYFDNGANAAKDKTEGDTFINFGQPADLQFGNEDFSIVLWVKTTEGGKSNSALVSNKDYSSGSNIGFTIGDLGATVSKKHVVNFSAKKGSRVEIVGLASNDDNWHQIAATFDRDGDMVAYIDGVEHDRKSLSAHRAARKAEAAQAPAVLGESDLLMEEVVLGQSEFLETPETEKKALDNLTLEAALRSVVDTGLDFVLGASGTKCNAISNTAVDELRVYRRALAGEEIQSLYNDVLLNLEDDELIEQGMILYTSFEDDTVSGTTLKDGSGHDNNGILVGEPAFVEAVKGKGIALDDGGGGQHVNFGNQGDLSLGTDSFSLSFWMKTTNGGKNNGTIFSNKDYASGNNKGFAIGNFNNNDDVDIRVNFSATGSSRVEVRDQTQLRANDDDWHHVVGVFNRQGDLIAYMDGEEAGRDNRMSGHRTQDASTGLPLILGADGTLKYKMSDVVIDELRIYNEAISPLVIEHLYAYDGVLLHLQRILEGINTIIPDSEITQADIDAAKQEVTDAMTEATTLTSAECIALIDEMNQVYNTLLAGSPPNITFFAVSDIHISNRTDAYAATFTKALQDMKEIDPNASAFISGGDNTSGGNRSQQDAFWGILTENQPVEDEGMLIALGNHDVREGSDRWSNEPDADTPFYFNTAYPIYMEKNAPFMPDTGGKIYFDKWIDGYHFTVLNTEKGLKDSIYMSPEQVHWLEDTLEENARPDQPNFLVVHQPLRDTHWRSNVLNGFGHNDDEVKEILRKYPQTIVMIGHIHNGFGVVEAVDRDFGTSVEIPSLNASETGVKPKGIGYHVSVYDNRVIYRARNFAESKWLPEHDIIINTNSLPIAYGEAVKASEKVHTVESWAPVQSLMNQAKKTLIDLKYDQSWLAWNTVELPKEGLHFTKALRNQHEHTARQLTEALENIVEVPEKAPLSLVEDAYLQAGIHEDKKPSEYNNYQDGYLRIKNSDDDNNQNFTRKTVLTFALDEAYMEYYNQAKLRLTLGTTVTTPNPGKHFTSGEVYTIDSGWNSNDITWNTVSGREKVATFDRDNIAGGILEIDVSQAVVEAIDAGKTEISFELSIPEQANDNLLDAYSSRHSVHGDKAPNLELQIAELADPEFVAIREVWTDFILGGALDTSVSAVQTYIENLNTSATEAWDTMITSETTTRTRLWQDLDMTRIAGTSQAAKERSANVALTYYRLEDITKAYFTEGTDLYQQAQVKKELIKALDYMYENHYNESDTSTPVFGNWWHWEIGAPISSLTSTLLLFDDLTKEQVNHYVAAVNRYTPVADAPSGYPGSPAMTGANLIDKATAVALAGVLTENDTKLQHVRDAVKTVFEYVTTGDGFYEDGSFIQHQALAFIGGYGKDLYSKLSTFFVVLDETPWELSYEDNAESLVFDMLFKAVLPFYHDGRFMDMVSGRDIVRKTKNDRNRGVEISQAILPMRMAIPADQKDAFDSIVKDILEADPEYFFEKASNITAIMQAVELLADDSVAPLETREKNLQYGGMDKHVYARDNYALGLGLHSSRTYGHELINDEGKQTWNVADGATYLYTTDKNQFSEGFWATIDPTRIPGTTAEHTVHPKGAADRKKNVHDWVGASTFEQYGAVGMHYKALGTGGAFNGADVKKSWFLLEDEIVALGSGITSNTGNSVETVVDNRKIQQDASNNVYVDGQAVDILTTSNTGTAFENPTSIFVEGNVSGDGMGYYFPTDITVNALKETRDGDWINQGSSSGAATASYATLWVDHGANPTNEDYAYVLVPATTKEKVAALAENSDIRILANTPDVHGVSKPSAGVTAVNFWNNSAPTVAGISTNQPASITMVRKDGVLSLAVSDPTQKSNTPIEVVVNASTLNLISADSNITVVEQGNQIKLRVDAQGLMGASSHISFAYDEAALEEVVHVEAQDLLEVPLFTPFEQLPLPETIEITTSQAEIYRVDVVWEKGDYNRTTVGTYELTGRLSLPAEIENPAGLKATILVKNGDTKGVVLGDTYVQGGSDGGKPGSNWEGSSLVVKYDNGAQNYTRKSIIKMDISGVPATADDIILKLEATGTMTKDFEFVNLYWLENDWNASEVTFNSFPVRMENQEFARITRADVNKGLLQEIDVTEVVQKALEQGMTEFSIELSIPIKADQNLIHFHSSRSVTGQVPELVWETQEQDGDSQWNLEVILALAKGIDSDEFQPFDKVALQAAIDTGTAVLADPFKSTEEIRAAERALTQRLSALRKKVLASTIGG